MHTPGPWTIEDYTNEKRGGYISIRGPNGEAICDIFPHAGKGGVGIEVALQNAYLICRCVLTVAEDRRLEDQ
jgi:hypothetical protein